MQMYVAQTNKKKHKIYIKKSIPNNNQIKNKFVFQKNVKKKITIQNI